MPKGKELKIFTGNANRELAERVAAYIGQPLGDVNVGPFTDGETGVEYRESVRGCHVVVVQPTGQPESSLKELKLMLRAARGSSAAYVTAVFPYFGYARQDRRDRPRVPISAKMVAEEIVAAGAQHVILLDPHSSAVPAFFPDRDCCTDHLYGRPVFIGMIRHLGLGRLRCGMPDLGSRTKVAQSYMRRLQGGIFFTVKGDDLGREGAKFIIGDVKDADCLLIDDEISTGKTIRDASDMLRKEGARSIIVVASHGKCVQDAPEILAASPVDHYYMGDTVIIPPRVAALLGPERFSRVTFAPLLGEAIKHVHDDDSISALFDDDLIAQIYQGNYLLP